MHRLFLGFLLIGTLCSGADLKVGLAQREITPEGPIWLAGYAARRKPSERSDHPLLVQAAAIAEGQERFVLVSLDNCAVSQKFNEPIYLALKEKHGLDPGQVMIVSS